MSDTDAAIELFNTHVNELEAEHGVELDAAERQRILGQSIAGGFSPESTAQAFGEIVGDDEYEDDDDEDYEDEEADAEKGTDRLVRHVQDDVARLSAEYGRPLTVRETEIIAEGALGQAERYDQVNAEEALEDHYRATGETRPDTGTQEGRNEYFRQRLAPAPREVPDEIDMTTSEGRSQYYDARLNGGYSADDFTDVEA